MSAIRDYLANLGQVVLDALALKDGDSKLSPQQLASAHALGVKIGNAHKFVPRGRGELGDSVIVSPAVYVTANPRFPKNLMTIRPGMDRKTFEKAWVPVLQVADAEFKARYEHRLPRAA